MDDLLKDAIADAKAVRETALENAKIALEEAFTPRLQSMLSKKIQSEIEVDEERGDEDDREEEGSMRGEEGEERSKEGDDMEERAHEDEDEVEEGIIEIDGVKYAPVVSEEEEDEKKDEVAELKANLDEHRSVIEELRGKLNEVNLLNAKLLFTNKLFRKYGLNNEQKMKVVEQFDRASNLREVKLVYSTLGENFGARKNEINESKGAASKPVASTKSEKEVITESNDLRDRFKKLANLI